METLLENEKIKAILEKGFSAETTLKRVTGR
jgi:hypothetical protein